MRNAISARVGGCLRYHQVLSARHTLQSARRGFESSSRAARVEGMLPDYLVTGASSQTCFHPTQSPSGLLQMSVAENKCVEKSILNRILELTPAQAAFTADAIYYQDTRGRLACREAMSRFLSRLSNGAGRPQYKFSPDHVYMGAGCNAALENLIFCLTEAKDAVLIPTPFYAAFYFDLSSRVGCEVVPVSTLEQNGYLSDAHHSTPIPVEAYYPSKRALDTAYSAAVQRGNPPKVLLLCHPNNPLGICYPSSVLQECQDWATEKGIHLVSDEIYAGSIFNQEEQAGRWVGMAGLAASSDVALPHNVHVVYALSKGTPTLIEKLQQRSLTLLH